jgi:hypothetical protein
MVTDTDITETPIGSVSLIIDTLGAVANVKQTNFNDILFNGTLIHQY